MAMDVAVLIQGIIQRVLAASAGDDVFVAQDGEVTEELIADALGNRIAQMLMGDGPQASDTKRSFELDNSAVDLAHYEELVERNGLLAGALGACDCWGLQADCVVCQGAGRSGWRLPDKRLFSNLVRPAIDKVSRLSASSHGAATQVRRPMKGG
jgi:hypothetical protein